MEHSRRVFTVFIFVFLFIIVAYSADPVAVIVKTRGRVNLTSVKSSRSKLVKKGQVLYDGDKLQTGRASFCALKFIDDKSLLRVKENSSCVIEGKRDKDHINKNVLVEVGSFFASLFKQRGTFTVTTPTSVASVKGTQFWIIQMRDGRTMYIGIEGLVDLINDAGRVLLREGQTAVVTSKKQLPEIRLTKEGEAPTLDEQDNQTKTMEIEFKDPSGQTKKLRLEYKEQ